ncbi:hypothetical protein P154DRAFT_569203 [Amniculicola lignicola CBS 123094]|uniref:Uncharacterized protein n=1 Tax=Amniculicola lignicola CBS 123094 TaxID=1392246 RepID=A0A6A5X331_9PLEO|nr:hypothetical protein P154DRAFT_569203 [Amniculicola lignicola CBS 123094]
METPSATPAPSNTPVPTYTLGVPPSILAERYPLSVPAGPLSASIGIAVITILCALIIGSRKHKPAYSSLNVDVDMKQSQGKVDVNVEKEPENKPQEEPGHEKTSWGGTSTTLQDTERNMNPYKQSVPDPGWPLPPRPISPWRSESMFSSTTEQNPLFAQTEPARTLPAIRSLNRQNLEELEVPGAAYMRGYERESYIPSILPLFSGRQGYERNVDSRLEFGGRASSYERSGKMVGDTDSETQRQKPKDTRSQLSDSSSLPSHLNLGSVDDATYVASTIGHQNVDGDPW